MTPFFKIGFRKWEVFYSIKVNGERHERRWIEESHSAEHAGKSLIAKYEGQDVEIEIHSITPVS